MDRKTKILLSVLNPKDDSRLNFLNVPNNGRPGTDENEKDLIIQGE